MGRAAADARQPRLIDLTWGEEGAPKVTLVGKGVCFDTGGLDIKPASAMLTMKKDMGGAAHVLGLASMVMRAKLPTGSPSAPGMQRGFARGWMKRKRAQQAGQDSQPLAAARSKSVTRGLALTTVCVR